MNRSERSPARWTQSTKVEEHGGTTVQPRAFNPRDLVQAVMRGDDLAARQWVKDAKRAGVDFSEVEDPGLSGDERVVAAALFELLAERQGKRPASWTTTAGSASKPVFLLKDAETSPAMRRLSERGTPPSMRARNVFALRDYLNVL